jgi:hypothetical protein
MTGKSQFNVPAFIEAGEKLREDGYGVQLPADLDDPEVVDKLMKSADGLGNSGSGLTWGDCLAMDVKLIADIVDGIAVIPGWSKSKGARLETFVAFLCNKPVVYANSMRKVRKRDLIKAWLGIWA